MRLEELPPVPGVTHRFVEARGVRFHVAEAGEGPPLVLLHGWPQHWWVWRKLIPRLASRWRVLAPDLRGWGWSDAPPGAYDKQTFAEDVLALLDAEGLDRVTLLAHDWGAFASFLIALDHPERVERLVALDIAPPFPPRPHPAALLLPVFLSYQFALVTPGLGPALLKSGRLVPLLLRVGSGPGFRFGAEEVAAFAEPLREPARARASVSCYRTFLARELARSGRRPEQLRVPTTLIMGGAGLLNTVARPQPGPSLDVEVLPGVGHFVAEEAPDDVLRISGL